jgi:glycine/D-amino acid oxidase-like deaminating enzyme
MPAKADVLVIGGGAIGASVAYKARSMGARFLAGEVTGLVRQGHCVTAVRLASGQLVEASHVVIAAGAWAKQVCALIDVPVPIEPLRHRHAVRLHRRRGRTGPAHASRLLT